jgi:hypothetical protein
MRFPFDSHFFRLCEPHPGLVLLSPSFDIPGYLTLFLCHMFVYFILFIHGSLILFYFPINSCSLPTVFGIVDGKLKDQFIGLPAERDVRAFVDKMIAAGGDKKA